MDLKNKVALVTGGAHRVGKAIAIGLAKEGMRIALHYNSSENAAQATQAAIQEFTADACLFKGDFSKLHNIKTVVNSCYEHFGQIDVLINNAAIYFKTPMGKITEQDWDSLHNINLKAPFFCCQTVANIMKSKKEGKIINIADVAGINPWADFIPYSASKAGLISITKGLAKALAPNIQVNAIASGTVLMAEDASQDHIDEIKELSLLKRIGSPNDIVNTVLFLLKGTDFVTGEVVVVDGGRQLKC